MHPGQPTIVRLHTKPRNPYFVELLRRAKYRALSWTSKVSSSFQETSLSIPGRSFRKASNFSELPFTIHENFSVLRPSSHSPSPEASGRLWSVSRMCKTPATEWGHRLILGCHPKDNSELLGFLRQGCEVVCGTGHSVRVSKKLAEVLVAIAGVASMIGLPSIGYSSQVPEHTLCYSFWVTFRNRIVQMMKVMSTSPRSRYTVPDQSGLPGSQHELSFTKCTIWSPGNASPD